MNSPSFRFSSMSLSRFQTGYSLVEWMITIVLALFLTAGLFSIFISSRAVTSESLSGSERQESATFAMQLLVRDLKQAYFFAQSTGENSSLWTLNGASIAVSDDCIDNASIGSFPSGGVFRPLWAATVPASLTGMAMTCIDDNETNTSLIADSDYLSLKRTRGLAQTDQFVEDRYYLDISTTGIDVYLGNSSSLSNGDVSTAWEYIHHVYYLDKEGDVPRLRRIKLEKNKMQLQEVIAEGIEDMQFMFALDNLIASDRTGSINAFIGTSQVTNNDWNTGRVIGMKIFLLARSLKKTPGYKNTDSYQLGDRVFTAPGDAYKREVSSQVITFDNSVVSIDE
ncbi:PilW family protein [Psychromonas sp.]|nr:PilW family protein [Psychromonas sp.]